MYVCAYVSARAYLLTYFYVICISICVITYVCRVFIIEHTTDHESSGQFLIDFSSMKILKKNLLPSNFQHFSLSKSLPPPKKKILIIKYNILNITPFFILKKIFKKPFIFISHNSRKSQCFKSKINSRLIKYP